MKKEGEEEGGEEEEEEQGVVPSVCMCTATYAKSPSPHPTAIFGIHEEGRTTTSSGRQLVRVSLTLLFPSRWRWHSLTASSPRRLLPAPALPCCLPLGSHCWGSCATTPVARH